MASMKNKDITNRIETADSLAVTFLVILMAIYLLIYVINL